MPTCDEAQGVGSIAGQDAQGCNIQGDGSKWQTLFLCGWVRGWLVDCRQPEASAGPQNTDASACMQRRSPFGGRANTHRFEQEAEDSMHNIGRVQAIVVHTRIVALLNRLQCRLQLAPVQIKGLY